MRASKHLAPCSAIIGLALAASMTVRASLHANDSSEAGRSARRTAARALERTLSTEWLPDVADRLRALEEQDRRATEGFMSDAQPGGLLRSPVRTVEPGGRE